MGRRLSSKPASAAMAWILSAMAEVVVLLPKANSALTFCRPASLSSARARSTSRLGTGNLSL
ncbi:Uncharacterised protein [Bordetella pertussis]|nr:Uncharacterised protein [Bordetella pertussis]